MPVHFTGRVSHGETKEKKGEQINKQRQRKYLLLILGHYLPFLGNELGGFGNGYALEIAAGHSFTQEMAPRIAWALGRAGVLDFRIEGLLAFGIQLVAQFAADYVREADLVRSVGFHPGLVGSGSLLGPLGCNVVVVLAGVSVHFIEEQKWRREVQVLGIHTSRSAADRLRYFSAHVAMSSLKALVIEADETSVGVLLMMISDNRTCQADMAMVPLVPLGTPLGGRKASLLSAVNSAFFNLACNAARSSGVRSTTGFLGDFADLDLGVAVESLESLDAAVCFTARLTVLLGSPTAFLGRDGVAYVRCVARMMMLLLLLQGADEGRVLGTEMRAEIRGRPAAKRERTSLEPSIEYLGETSGGGGGVALAVAAAAAAAAASCHGGSWRVGKIWYSAAS